MSKNILSIFRRAWLLAILVSLWSLKLPAAERPNIVIIFTDDQGYADLACYGNTKNKTPVLDRLAKEGTRFTSFYAQSVCGPSRSALLTGRYPFRSKGWSMPASEITFAELMQKAGYQTACIGKWDVSNRKAILPRMPNAQGFDYYFGTLGANDGGGVAFHENNQPAGNTRDMGSLTRLYTDKAIGFLEHKRDAKKPFVLYVAHTMMHTIIDASEKFRGKSKGGLYGDVVEEFDFETGRLLSALEKLKLADNTLVIYTSDNGPWNQPAYTNRKKGHPKGAIFWGEAGPLRDGKGSCYEAGYRVPCIVRWPGKVPAGRVSGAIFSTLDFMPTFAKLAGFKVPGDRVIDGVDQTDLLLGKSAKGEREIFVYRNNGIRKGKWKYLKAKHNVYGYARDTTRKEVEELYDLEADLSETKNLATRHPAKVAELRALMEKITKGKAGRDAKIQVEAPRFQLDYKDESTNGKPRQIQTTVAKDSVAFDVTDQFGIGGGSIRLVAGQWPETIIIRLHLKGLEWFSISVGDKKLPRRELNVRKIAGPGKANRLADYYEARVPGAVLMDADEFNLNWVDFFRR